jgi:hypothetical protein
MATNKYNNIGGAIPHPSNKPNMWIALARFLWDLTILVKNRPLYFVVSIIINDNDGCG